MCQPNLRGASPITFVAGLQQKGSRTLDDLLLLAGAVRRAVVPGETLLIGGMHRCSLFLVRFGLFKLCIASEDGGERITGFRMSTDLLGVDNWGYSRYGCSAVAIEPGEVLEIPSRLIASNPDLQEALQVAVSREVNCCCAWDHAMSGTNPQQRLAAFFLDLATRHYAASMNPWELPLRAYWEQLGSVLGLSRGDVADAMSGLARDGLISGDRFEVEILDIDGLRQLAEPMQLLPRNYLQGPDNTFRAQL